jgi:hypothetical protein
MVKLEYAELKKDMKVIDTEGNIGKIMKIKDIHNILVKFERNAGYGFYCLDQTDKMFYDPLYKIE